MTDASADDARIAWIIGGSLLIASALFPLVTQGVFLPGLGLVTTALWAASLLVFALGVRTRGSVVGRRPLGVTALVVAALIPVAGTVFWRLVPLSPEGDEWAVLVNQGVQVVLLAALIVATVQIARTGVVPSRVRWLPLIVLAAAVAAQVVVAAVLLNMPSQSPDGLSALLSIAGLVGTAAPLALGIAAIVLAPRIGRVERVEPEPVQVYPPTA